MQDEIRNDNIRDLIHETTGLLRELILEQGRKLDGLKMTEQLTIEAVKDITGLVSRIDRLEEKQAALTVLVAEHKAAEVILAKYYDKEENRGYQERKSLAEKIWDNAAKISGIVALLAVIAQIVIK